MDEGTKKDLDKTLDDLKKYREGLFNRGAVGKAVVDAPKDLDKLEDPKTGLVTT